MYKNLLAEMSKRGISKKDLATFLNMRYPTVVDKTNGRSRFYLDEAFKLRDGLFPDCNVEYLFEVNEIKAS